MPSFEITLRDGASETLEGADAYQQEGPMTTFFRTGDGRSVIDVWSTRVASFRTADLLSIRRHDTNQVSTEVAGSLTRLPA